ncbi:MAG TPA: IS1634 family transposase [Candidatus Sulfotelmatobacter sp.]
MQEERLRLRGLRVGALPILNHFIGRMGLEQELRLALKNAGYADALLALLKNIVVDRNALYAVGEWIALYDEGLVWVGKVGDDKIGRALDRLFAADRATLQTRIVLAVMNGFQLTMERIHNDTTSVMVRGAYDLQNPKAVQLKRGHSKERRPDLKQLVFSLCVTADGAVPVHFKAYDGNQTDDGIHLETWSRLRTLLQHPGFIYVADCKLCTEKNLRTIDGERGFFVTVVPKTRSEVATFTEAVLAGDVRWEEVLRKRADRDKKFFDVVECAVGPYHLREGFIVHWYRSSQKMKRDVRDREERIERAVERLESLDLRRMRGPKTDAAIRKRVDAIIAQYGAEDWVTVEIKWDAIEKFKAVTRGKPTVDTVFRRIIQQVPRLHVSTDAASISRSAAMDGIFPLTTNTKEKPIDVFKIYKYQPRIEKRHALLKSTLEVAPIWLKKNTRIEALMFLEFLGQMVAALIERELRQQMLENNVDLLCSLPEGRASKTPTIEQVLRLFENQNKHVLYEGDRLIRQFADPLTPVQSQILQLLSVPTTAYAAGK